MFSISFAITYIVILTCVMFLNLIISLSVLWIDNDIIAYIALQKQPLLFQYQFLDRHKRISLSLQFINNQKCCIYR